jgi:hypothetical protein
MRNPIHTTKDELNKDSQSEFDKNKIKVHKIQSYLGSNKMKESLSHNNENEFTTSNIITNANYSQIKSYRKNYSFKEPMTEPKKTRYMYGKNNSVFYA